MALVFRNVTASPSDPVSSWPTEAVHTALERGDLDDWRHLATQLRHDPWGPTAQQVEEILAGARPYGVADAMEAVLERARARVLAAERATVAAEIRDLLAGTGRSRRELARRLGTSPTRLSTYANGTVTPAATFMLRLRRLHDDLAP